MPIFNGKEILRLTPKQAWDRGYGDPNSSVKEQNDLNDRIRPGQVTQMVFCDGVYMGICVKTDKLFQVIEKFNIK